jgi:hypothetical protein
MTWAVVFFRDIERGEHMGEYYELYRIYKHFFVYKVHMINIFFFHKPVRTFKRIGSRFARTAMGRAIAIASQLAAMEGYFCVVGKLTTLSVSRLYSGGWQDE